MVIASRLTPFAQTQQITQIPLWPELADSSIQYNEYGHITQLGQPTMTVYLPQKSNGMAVIACPGGGYSILAIQHEGHQLAKWFNEQGIAYIVLHYRLPNGNYNIPLKDAQKAFALVKQHATAWKIKQDQIGIMGFSAGGHLASTVATHFTTQNRPAFQILFYPVISMDKKITHQGSRNQLLGTNASDSLSIAFSNELQITTATPPAFILLSSDDMVVVPENSIRYYQALLKNKIPAEIHCYPTGGHGWGFREDFLYKNAWTRDLAHWLTIQYNHFNTAEKK